MLLKYYILIQDGLWAMGAHLRMTVYMVEGKQSTYPNPAFMLAKITECKTLKLSYKPRLNQIWSITVAVTDSQANI